MGAKRMVGVKDSLFQELQGVDQSGSRFAPKFFGKTLYRYLGCHFAVRMAAHAIG